MQPGAAVGRASTLLIAFAAQDVTEVTVPQQTPAHATLGD